MIEFQSVLQGISGILVTPFGDDGEIAPHLQAPIIDRAAEAGIHSLVANGNTGEFYALTGAEADAMVRASAEMIAGRLPLIGGVGRGVREAVSLAKASVDAGASAIMVHQPPDPFAAPRGFVDYVAAIADAISSTPIILYVRNDAIGFDHIARACEAGEVVGIKWATPNPLRMAEAARVVGSGVQFVCGLAESWAPAFYAAGARGYTSGIINVWPEHTMAIHAALEGGDFVLANQLIERMREFEALRAEEQNGTNVSVVKASLSLLGHDCGSVRPPSAWPMTATQSARLSDFLARRGVPRFGG